MEITSDSVYLDRFGVRHIQVRNIGYELYASLKEEGSPNICGGFVGPSCGWQEILPAEQSDDDRKFLEDIKKVAR